MLPDEELPSGEQERGQGPENDATEPEAIEQEATAHEGGSAEGASVEPSREFAEDEVSAASLVSAEELPARGVLAPARGDETVRSPAADPAGARPGPSPPPGGKGRLIDVGFRPRGQIQVLPVGRSLPIEEQQPGLEQSAELPRDLMFRPERDQGGAIEQMPYRPGDESRVFPPAVKMAGAPAPTHEQLQAVPRLVVMVSLANARALFDDALERAASKMAPKFQDLAKFEIGQYAFQRKSAERAANPGMRGPLF